MVYYFRCCRLDGGCQTKHSNYKETHFPTMLSSRSNGKGVGFKSETSTPLGVDKPSFVGADILGPFVYIRMCLEM